MKKTLALLLALLLAVTAAACGNTQESFTKGPEDPAVIRIGMTAEPMTLDPGSYATTEEATVISHLFQCLTAKDESGTVTGAAAESWEITATDDAAERPIYTFTLREDAVWSDGTAVTSEDFIYAWTRIISGETESPYAYLFDVILGASEYSEDTAEELGLVAVDEQTLEVTLEGDCAYFPVLTALPAFAPVREDAVEQNPTGWYNSPETLLCNGAYTMTAWVHDDCISLAKNESYRLADEVLCGKLDFVIRSGEALEAAAKDGSIAGAMADMDTAVRTKLRDGSLYCFAVNTETVPDANVRRALALTLDRESALNAAGYAGEAITEGEVSRRIDLTDRLMPGEALMPSAPEAAAALLAEAEEVPESLTLLTNYITAEENDANVLIAKAAAAQWEASLGIRVTVKALPYDEFVTARDAGEYDIIRCGLIADFDDAAAYLELFESGVAMNYANFASDDYDELMRDSRSETDPAERQKLLEEAEELLIVENAAVIPLRSGTVTLTCSAGLTGCTANGLGIWDFSRAVYTA